MAGALPGQSLGANFAWTTAGNSIGAAAQWGVIVLLARLGSPAMVGQYALGLAIASPAFLFAGLNLRTVQATDIRCDFDFGDYLTLRLLGMACAFLAVAGILGWSGFRTETTVVILAVALTKAFESLSDVCYGLHQQQERMDQIAKSMIGRGLGSLVVLGTLLAVGISIVWSAIALAGVAAFVALFYDLRSCGSFPRPRWRNSSVGRIARLAAPLGVIGLLMTLNTNMPRYFLAEMRSEHEAGLFAALGYVAVATNTVVMAFGQAASPRLARYHAFGDLRRLLWLAAKLVLLAGGLGIGGALVARVWGSAILGLMYGPEYAYESRVFELLMWVAALGLLASAIGYVLSSTRCFARQIPMFLAVGAVTTWVCWRLTPTEGLWGAAHAQLWGGAAQLALSLPLLMFVLIRAYAPKEENICESH